MPLLFSLNSQFFKIFGSGPGPAPGEAQGDVQVLISDGPLRTSCLQVLQLTDGPPALLTHRDPDNVFDDMKKKWGRLS